MIFYFVMRSFSSINKVLVDIVLVYFQVLVVFGATGVQGGSVTRALLQNPKYKVKAVTRNTNSEKAKLLNKEGT